MENPVPHGRAFGRPGGGALYFVCNTASQYLKVVLSGEGADEIFGGYNIYKEPLEMQWYDKIPFPIRRLIGKIAGALPPTGASTSWCAGASGWRSGLSATPICSRKRSAGPF